MRPRVIPVDFEPSSTEGTNNDSALFVPSVEEGSKSMGFTTVRPEWTREVWTRVDERMNFTTVPESGREKMMRSEIPQESM